MACVFSLHSCCSLSHPAWKVELFWEENGKAWGLNLNKKPLVLHYYDLGYLTWWKVCISLAFDFYVASVWRDESIAEGKEQEKVGWWEAEYRWGLWEGPIHLSLHGVVPCLLAEAHCRKGQARNWQDSETKQEVWSGAGDKSLAEGTVEEGFL